MNLISRPPIAVFVISMFVCWMPLVVPTLERYSVQIALAQLVIFSIMLALLTLWTKSKVAFLFLLFPGFQGLALVFTSWNAIESLYFFTCLIGAYLVMLRSKFFETKLLSEWSLRTVGTEQSGSGDGYDD